MAEFLVKVADEQGHLRQQVEHGYSEAEVHDRFTQQGYLVYWVKPRTISARAAAQFGKRGKLRQSAFLIFNQQFLTLIKAGLPILTALDLLIKRQRDKSLLQMLENVRERVKGGELLSDAFAAQQMFPKMYTTTLMAGEKSGNMEEVLSRYIAYQRMVQTFRKKLAGVAGLSGAAGCGGDGDADFPDHLRGAEVRRPVQQPGRATAGDHGVHAGGRPERAEIWLDRGAGRGGGSRFVLALEAERPRGRTRSTGLCCRCR